MAKEKIDAEIEVKEAAEAPKKTRKKKEEKTPKKSESSASTEETKEDKPLEKVSKSENANDKLKKLKEKAEKLASKLEGIKTEDIKGKLEESRKTLVPLEDYIRSGIYIGTKVITPHMRQFVYRRRNDGIAILDVNAIDKKLKDAVKRISEFAPENFILVCKREAGWKAVRKFAEVIGVKCFMKKYPAGILTNPSLPNFFETDMVLVCDPWIDKNAINDAKIIKKEVIALCDTNNYTFDIDHLIPCNNKSEKSIGIVLYIIAREYLKARGIDKELKMEDFTGDMLQQQE